MAVSVRANGDYSQHVSTMLFVSLIPFPFLGVLFVFDGLILRRPATILLVSPILFHFLGVLFVLNGLTLRKPAIILFVLLIVFFSFSGLIKTTKIMSYSLAIH